MKVIHIFACFVLSKCGRVFETLLRQRNRSERVVDGAPVSTVVDLTSNTWHPRVAAAMDVINSQDGRLGGREIRRPLAARRSGGGVGWKGDASAAVRWAESSQHFPVIASRFEAMKDSPAARRKQKPEYGMSAPVMNPI